MGGGDSASCAVGDAVVIPYIQNILCTSCNCACHIAAAHGWIFSLPRVAIYCHLARKSRLAIYRHRALLRVAPSLRCQGPSTFGFLRKRALPEADHEYLHHCRNHLLREGGCQLHMLLCRRKPVCNSHLRGAEIMVARDLEYQGEIAEQCSDALLGRDRALPRSHRGAHSFHKINIGRGGTHRLVVAADSS